MTARELLPEIKSRLEEAYGERLRGVVLYGSQARGDARPDSDIDILVLLDGPVQDWVDLRRATDAIYPLILQHGVIIDAHPVDAELFDHEESPLYALAHREGIRV